MKDKSLIDILKPYQLEFNKKFATLRHLSQDEIEKFVEDNWIELKKPENLQRYIDSLSPEKKKEFEEMVKEEFKKSDLWKDFNKYLEDMERTEISNM